MSGRDRQDGRDRQELLEREPHNPAEREPHNPAEREASAERHERLQPLIAREIAGIAAIDVAVPHLPPDYVVLCHDTKNGKQANVEQMATLVRMTGGTPPESGGIRRIMMKAQTAAVSRVSITAALQGMRLAEAQLVTMYADAIAEADGLEKRALTKAIGRALVHAHVLTAHLAKRNAGRAFRPADSDARLLPFPLSDYFAGAEPKACMRCHLDRPGTLGALERTEPHPYTYICAGCHDEVVEEFPGDLADQMDRWPRNVREAKVIQHAIGRVSKLNAIGRVLHPLSGLAPEIPVPAANLAVIVPAMTPTPGPAEGEREGVMTIAPGVGLEEDYTSQLFDPARIRRSW
jgi:hypothetical protein